MQPRKYVTAERSAQKESSRPSYQRASYIKNADSNFHGDLSRFSSSNNLLKVHHDDKMRYSQLQRSPSEVGFKNREELVRSNIARRKNDGMVSNLKSELQSLKMQVSKLMNKESDPRGLSARKSVKSEDEYSDKDDNIELGNYGKDISDTVSVTSEKIINEPLRKLENTFGSSNYDHSHYMQLENDLLKTQLRNLKNKYNATKQELKQKCEALEKKNDYLQVSLQKSEESLQECKKNLQVEIQTIKFQLTRKMKQEMEEQEKKAKSRQMIEPERDSGEGNQLLQNKLNTLYEELNEKSKILSELNIQLNEVKGKLEKKSFEMKKEVEKNSELSKQFEFSKRQNMRNGHLLEQEVSKKNQLLKTIENLKEKVNDLTKQLRYQDQVNNGSEELQNRLSLEIKEYKKIEERLSEQNLELQTTLRKQRQLNDSHQQEIKHLKKSVGDFTAQIEQISRNLRQQKEKSLENEEHYRNLIDEIKENYEKKLESLRDSFEKARQNAQEASLEKQEAKSVVRYDLKEKERLIGKWKTEYKLLKIKFQENFAQENSKKEEIQGYYKSYKEYKSKNKLLEMRNKVLEESANESIEKVHEIESSHLQARAKDIEEINKLEVQNEHLQRKIEELLLQAKELETKYRSENQKANSEEKLRSQLESKVLNLDIEDNEELMGILEHIKRRVNDQDEKINKAIKQGKKKDELITKLRKQIRTLLETQQIELQNFKNKQIAELVEQIKKKNYESLKQIQILIQKEQEVTKQANEDLIDENTKFKVQIGEMESQLMDLKQQVKSITHLYNFKSAELEELREKHSEQMEIQEAKLEEIERFKNATIKNLQAEINGRNEQISMQRTQIKKMLSIRMNVNDEPFDEALRNQIETSKKLREQLSLKNEEVYKLRDNFSLLKTQLDNLKSENEIGKLKFISDKKNLQVSCDVEIQQLKNQLSLEQKKISSLENKIKMVIDENKKKDSFIQTYIMGKKLPQSDREFITSFLREFEITVTGKNINEKLQSQSQELQKLASYNFNLMKEVAEMKERMLLYEAISVDHESQLRDSADLESPVKKKRVNKSQSMIYVEDESA